MKRKTCPKCGHRFGLLTEPKLKSKNDIHLYVCASCGTDLRIVGGIKNLSRSMGIIAAIGALIITAKWIAYRFAPAAYAEVAWFVLGFLIMAGGIAVVAASFEYEAQQGAPADVARPAGERRG